MALKGFNKNLQKSCLWCVHGTKSEYSDEIFCKKRGVTTRADACRKYKYDPLKRTPLQVKPAGEFTKEDFSL
ncbi:MAG: hypothetical protein IKJ50_05290 [Clostridia bacterium]|nr:hypothetical protein [Clostridia bacterium]